MHLGVAAASSGQPLPRAQGLRRTAARAMAAAAKEQEMLTLYVHYRPRREEGAEFKLKLGLPKRKTVAAMMKAFAKAVAKSDRGYGLTIDVAEWQPGCPRHHVSYTSLHGHLVGYHAPQQPSWPPLQYWSRFFCVSDMTKFFGTKKSKV